MARAKKPAKIDKYTKVQPKVHPYTIIGIVGFFIVVFGLIFIFQPSKEQLIYRAYTTVTVANKTSGLTEDHPFKDISYRGGLFSKGLDKVIEQEEIVVLYIGTPTCSVCVQHIGAFQRYFFEEKIDEYVDQIYYLNPTTDQRGFNQMVEKYQQIGAFTPQLIIFKDGQIIGSFEVESNDNVQTMNSSVRTFFRNIYSQLD